MMVDTQFSSPSAARIVGAGSLTGLLSVLFAISYGTVIFTGPLAPHVSLGINLALFSSAVIGCTIALRSSHRGAVAGVSDSAVILGLIAVEIQMVKPGMDILPTFLVSISLASLATGILLWLLGKFRSGGLARYIPYPVMGGFLAGVGWLMSKGAVSSMTGTRVGWENLAMFVEGEMLLRWVPGVVLGLLVFTGGSRRFTPSVLTAMAAALVLFWIVAIAAGIPLETLRAEGWLIGPFHGVMPEMQMEHLGALATTDWWAIFGEVPKFGSVAVTTLVGLLLTAASMELTTRHDLDLNQELRAAGLGNILSGLGGGLMGFHYLSSTNLAHRMRADHRMVGVVNAVICLIAIGVGALVFSFVPKILTGTLLIAIGTSFLNTWLIQSYKRMSHADYAVLLLVFLVVVFVGFIQGIVVGLVVGGVLFVVNYSRIDIVKMAVSGEAWASNVDRPEQEREILRRDGDAAFVLALQGFLFFGTANRLLRRVKKRLDEEGRSPIKFVVVDFKWTRGLDSSVALAFKRLCQYAQDQDFELCLTSLQPEYLATLEREGLRPERRVLRDVDDHDLERRRDGAEADIGATSDGRRFYIFPDLDHGLEWCEERILSLAEVEHPIESVGLAELLAREFPEGALVERVLRRAQQVTFQPGDLLINEGSEGDNLFMIESGRVSVRIAVTTGQDVRVKSLGPGNLVGEIALYRGSLRGASVVADKPTVAYVLTREELEQMRDEEPTLAAAFHEFMARYLAGRLDDTTRLVAAMAK